MSTTVRVFVDGVGYDAPKDGTALDAIVVSSPAKADEVRQNAMLITDSRGLPVAPDIALFNGAVFRLVPNRERDTNDPASRFDN